MANQLNVNAIHPAYTNLCTPATSTLAAQIRDKAFDTAPVPPAHADDVNAKFDLEAGSQTKWVDWIANVWPKEDEAASRMLVVPEAGMPGIRMVYNYYHSGKGMDAWLDHIPADGKLKFRLVTGVSWHDGEARAKQYAKINTYAGAVRGPTGSPSVKQFGPAISRTTELASSSDAITLDVSKPGDYKIECWPVDSAGVYGYVEGRQLILHITGKEPRK